MNYTATFLINSDSPDEIIFLKRAEHKEFAPGFFTGIGGKVGDTPDIAGESALDGAYRELKEETGGDLNRENICLVEFARIIYDHGVQIHYFIGEYTSSVLPVLLPAEGELIRVNTNMLAGLPFIPSVQLIIDEWGKRAFANDQPFTIYVRDVGKENTVTLVELMRVVDGLA